MKFLMNAPPEFNPMWQTAQMPESFVEALKDVDQFVKCKFTLGADAEEILTSDKPLVEHLMAGFKGEFEASFLKQVKKAFKAGIEGGDSEFHQMAMGMMDMAGPGFKFSSNVAMELNFDDMDEVKSHPMAQTFLVSLDQLLQGVFQSSVQDVKDWKPDFPEKKEIFD